MKKIIIFTSTGGGGHTSVTKSLTHLLHTTYDILPINIFASVLGPIDPAQLISRKKTTGENIYNYFIRKKWYRLLNVFYHIGAWYYNTLRRKKAEQLLERYLKEQAPAIIISVVPLINAIILTVAQKLNIPFLIIPTDLDVSSFIYNIYAPHYSKFACTSIFEDSTIKAMFTAAHIDQKLVTNTGLPLRTDFFTPKNNTSIKKKFNVPEEKFVVLVLMGAVGSRDIYTITHMLTQVSIPTHILICIGTYKDIQESLANLPLPDHITITIIGYTHEIANLMSITDLLITKSGSVSVTEGIYMNVPMLLDGTSAVLRWEQFNHSFIKKHGLGDIITSRDIIPKLVTQLFTNKSRLKNMKKNLTAFNKKRSDIEIPRLIADLIA